MVNGEYFSEARKIFDHSPLTNILNRIVAVQVPIAIGSDATDDDKNYKR